MSMPRLALLGALLVSGSAGAAVVNAPADLLTPGGSVFVETDVFGSSLQRLGQVSGVERSASPHVNVGQVGFGVQVAAVAPTPVPEPGSLALAAVALAAGAAASRSRRAAPLQTGE